MMKRRDLLVGVAAAPVILALPALSEPEPAPDPRFRELMEAFEWAETVTSAQLGITDGCIVEPDLGYGPWMYVRAATPRTVYVSALHLPMFGQGKSVRGGIVIQGEAEYTPDLLRVVDAADLAAHPDAHKALCQIGAATEHVPLSEESKDLLARGLKDIREGRFQRIGTILE